jgi:hypothetical protein
MISTGGWVRRSVAALFLGVLSSGWLRAGGLGEPVKLLAVVAFECATPAALPSGELSNLAARESQKSGSRGVAHWADRAWAIDLGGGPEREYLVPLDCGATGNCRWALLASSPPSVLGTVDGALVYIHARNAGWSDLTAYSTLGAGDGVVASYTYRNGRYASKSSHEVTGEDFDSFTSSFGLQPTCDTKSAAQPNNRLKQTARGRSGAKSLRRTRAAA